MVTLPKQLMKLPKGSPEAVSVMKRQSTLLDCSANALLADTQQQ
jgi:hypothetical protein